MSECEGCGRPIPPRSAPGGKPRTWCSDTCRHAHRARRTPAGLAPVDRERVPLLDIAPFRAWLAGLITEHGVDEACLALGVSQRRMFAWLHERTTVQLDTVDRVLSTEGGTHLRELYPHLYEPTTGHEWPEAA